MWPKKFPTGSWIDCLEAIEKEVSSLKGMLKTTLPRTEFTKKLSSHEVRNRFDDIWRYAGKAVKDLEKF